MQRNRFSPLLVSLLVDDRNDLAGLLHGLHIPLHRAVRVLELFPTDTPLAPVDLHSTNRTKNGGVLV